MEHDGKIKLGKIEVKMGKETVTLTVDQARELSALLKGLFGDDSTKIVHVRDHWYVRPWYFGQGSGDVYRGYEWQVSCVSNSTFALPESSTGPMNVTFNAVK